MVQKWLDSLPLGEMAEPEGVVRILVTLSPHKGDLSQRERIVLQGTVEFMVCNSEQCLPPEEVEFKVELK